MNAIEASSIVLQPSDWNSVDDAFSFRRPWRVRRSPAQGAVCSASPARRTKPPCAVAA